MKKYQSVTSTAFWNISSNRTSNLARLTGLEPATPGVTGRYSNQLSYNRALRSITTTLKQGQLQNAGSGIKKKTRHDLLHFYIAKLPIIYNFSN